MDAKWNEFISWDKEKAESFLIFSPSGISKTLDGINIKVKEVLDLSDSIIRILNSKNIPYNNEYDEKIENIFNLFGEAAECGSKGLDILLESQDKFILADEASYEKIRLKLYFTALHKVYVGSLKDMVNYLRAAYNLEARKKAYDDKKILDLI